MIEFRNQIIQSDCVQFLKTVPTQSIDLVITDPPFGIEFNSKVGYYNRENSRVVETYNEIPIEDYGQFCSSWIPELYRTLKPGGTCYIISGWSNLYHILHWVDQTEFETINHLIWKYQFGVWNTSKFITSHYHILYLVKPPIKKKTWNLESRYLKNSRNASNNLNYLDREDVFVINRPYQKDKEKYATQLPEELVGKLIQYSSNENDLVLDIFAGSGTTGVVSKQMNRDYCMVDINEKSIEFIQKRMSSQSTKHEFF